MKSIYLDYASITPLDPSVQKEMNRWCREPLNPSSIHSLGVKAKKALDDSHKSVGEFLNAHADEIVFTSGGTEANVMALEGTLKVAKQNGFYSQKDVAKPHLIISEIEHSSIIETASMLEKHGVEVTRLPVDKNGLVSLEQLKKSIKPETYMVSIMTANNEIGTIEPIREIAKVMRDVKKRRKEEMEKKEDSAPASPVGASYPLFHTDACQAVLYEELNVEKLGIDLLTLDASKACGPRGVGALYIKRNTPIDPIIYGGGQEKGLRSGTENVPGVAGFAKALEVVKNSGLVKNNKKVVNFRDMEKESQRVAKLRDYFEKEVKKIWQDAIINAVDVQRVPHISNIAFPNVDAEMLLLRLDAKGIEVSTKSACLRDEDESYVLRAIGADSKSSLRFSFGRWTKKRELKAVLKCLKIFVQV